MSLQLRPGQPLGTPLSTRFRDSSRGAMGWGRVAPLTRLCVSDRTVCVVFSLCELGLICHCSGAYTRQRNAADTDEMAPLRTLTPGSPEETSPQGSTESKLLARAQGGLLLSTKFARLSCTPEALVPHTEGRQASSSDTGRSQS